MKNTRKPVRPAPSVEEARLKKTNTNTHNVKKKPPPRPPPPDVNKLKSKSAWNLNQNFENLSLIEWSPPSSPKTSRPIGGSVCSSFSSSTSSLASSKKSFEYDPFNINSNSKQNDTSHKLTAMPMFNLSWSTKIQQPVESHNDSTTNASQVSMPTIIRPQMKPSTRLKTVPSNNSNIRNQVLSREYSPPMPSIPPPSPPKEVEEVTVPCAIALYNFPASQLGDLELQVNDIVYLIRRVSDEWLYGKLGDKEGMFPENFVDIQVPLPEDNNTVEALYEFLPQMPGDLHLVPGQKVKVVKILSSDWLVGVSGNKTGQFPANFVDKIPNI